MGTTASEGSAGGIGPHPEKFKSAFELCARHAVEAMLGIPTYSPRGFGLPYPAASRPSMTFQIRAGNAGYSAGLYLGLDASDSGKLLPGMAEGEIADAIGEIANVIAGTFMGMRAFSGAFGTMRLSPPVLAGGAGPEQESWRILGILTVNGARLYLGFTIKPNEKEDQI